jgi:uncharacterized protein YjiK
LKQIYKILIFVIVLLVYSCSKDSYEPDNTLSKLELINKFEINIEEPSGLTLDTNKGILYTVSDNSNKLYKITKEGVVLQEYEINATDLEGVCIYNSDLLLANEQKKQLIQYNTLSGSSTVYSINYSNNSLNSGIEGVAYNKTDNLIYILNEKNPGELLILNNNFIVIDSYILNFANDYSGICYSSKDNVLWITSDESSTINKCDLKGNLIKSYNINVNKCEGIALDINSGIIYVISDSESKMYLFKIKM